MKLLILTQKVNRDDPILGFFCRWITEFSKHFESIKVIALEVESNTPSTLPNNVKVFSLGKDKKIHTGLGKINYILRFYKYIWSLRDEYDAVFVHMNPIYVVLGGFIWKFLDKKMFLWYTHREVDSKLYIANKFVFKIFTASKESFRLKTSKCIITGHGISTDDYVAFVKAKKFGTEPIKLVHVGRITSIKNLDILIKSAKILKEKWNKKFIIEFVGDVISPEDKKYKEQLVKIIHNFDLSDYISFVGSIKNDKISSVYSNADMSINLSPTGGMDKVVLESMASSTIVLTSNQTFKEYFGNYADLLLFHERDAEDLSRKLIALFDLKDTVQITNFLRQVVMERANITVQIENISHIIVNYV